MPLTSLRRENTIQCAFVEGLRMSAAAIPAAVGTPFLYTTATKIITIAIARNWEQVRIYIYLQTSAETSTLLNIEKVPEQVRIYTYHRSGYTCTSAWTRSGYTSTGPGQDIHLPR
eukprot:2870787-Amphidinium_carterae.1